MGGRAVRVALAGGGSSALDWGVWVCGAGVLLLVCCCAARGVGFSKVGCAGVADCAIGAGSTTAVCRDSDRSPADGTAAGEAVVAGLSGSMDSAGVPVAVANTRIAFASAEEICRPPTWGVAVARRACGGVRCTVMVQPVSSRMLKRKPIADSRWRITNGNLPAVRQVPSDVPVFAICRTLLVIRHTPFAFRCQLPAGYQ